MITTPKQPETETTDIYIFDPARLMEAKHLPELFGSYGEYKFHYEIDLPSPSSKYRTIIICASAYSKAVSDSIDRWAAQNSEGNLYVVSPSKEETSDIFPFLHNDNVSGMMSVDYLSSNFDFVIRNSHKAPFLEPSCHRHLIHEIERVKLKEQPIKKLLLQKEKVADILTQNEQNVLQLLLEGYNNIHIAQELYLAPSTISTIISHLLKKMKASDRTDALVTSIRNGWVEAYR
ncbi:hypothetical protein CR205_15810 [Alteribacter lacisalsi]|uniref:HTH luxR-type domain-containing protein n=1 Tax=Alteribacter lacisalsi TaxID=2045244 RepID=A0A2W0HQJ5_9BACI|nr:LuxR C-terminal-related transcriptional regulator [Alteribacter lacisalsi]PYZ95848.1 hypothetical protein CR205_15810 [Alteribacter lacisalsi]